MTVRAPVRWRASVLVLVVAVVAAGCANLEGLAPSSSACSTGDVRAPGTNPDLEALLPKGMIERSPDMLDSGWNCTADSLGTYTAHGIHKLRFAGATWNAGQSDGTVVAILALVSGPLDPAWVEEFYTVGAVNARHVGEVKTDRPTMPDAGTVFRLETINDLSLQTVVIWPDAPYVHVVIVATEVTPDASRTQHDQRVETAVSVAAQVPVP